MAENQKGDAGAQETMQGVMREKAGDASSFADNQYAGESEPAPEGAGGSAGGPNVSQQGGGSGSSKQGGNTGTTTDASG